MLKKMLTLAVALGALAVAPAAASSHCADGKYDGEDRANAATVEQTGTAVDSWGAAEEADGGAGTSGNAGYIEFDGSYPEGYAQIDGAESGGRLHGTVRVQDGAGAKLCSGDTVLVDQSVSG